MTAFLIIVKEEHDCRKCHKTIRVGEKGVKSMGRESNCGGSYAVTVYYHEDCWLPLAGRRFRKGKGVA